MKAFGLGLGTGVLIVAVAGAIYAAARAYEKYWRIAG